MISRFCRLPLMGTVLILSLQTVIYAQEYSIEGLPPGLRDRAIIMEIAARITEQNQNVVWNSENIKVTMPGRPVGLRLVGDNVIVVVQFTPFLRPRGNSILVAQGQIWIQVPNEGMSLHTCMETIPLEFNEQIYFFPLGSSDSDDSKNEPRIEIQIVLYPYNSEHSWGRRTSQ